MNWVHIVVVNGSIRNNLSRSTFWHVDSKPL